ncbi:MAG: hypothetical protein P1U42_04405 [Phycisphaerales bacterium]|nr:hypothetical protein [Phycisphaerales bacterium]
MAKTGSGEADGIGEGNGGAHEVVEVPISEEVIWKSKAEEAEDRVAELEARIVDLERELSSAHESCRSVERRSEIDMELTAARAIDLETARLLTEATIAEMDAPDVSIAVRELCDRKPFLFAGKRQVAREGVSMGPVVSSSGDDELMSMAQRAKSSGDRSELLRYLRVRRGH